MSNRWLRNTLVLGGALLTLCAFAATASAQTFYVEGRIQNHEAECGLVPNTGGTVKNDWPCETIREAMEKAENSPPPNTIKVVAEKYQEALSFTNSQLAGLTIEAEHPGETVVLEAPSGTPAITATAAAESLTLSHIEIESGQAVATVVDNGAGLTLSHDLVRTKEGEIGVRATGAKPVKIISSTLEMESGPEGYAVRAINTPLSLESDQIYTNRQGGSEAGGVLVDASPSVSISNTLISVAAEVTNEAEALEIVSAGSAQLNNDLIKQNSPSPGARFIKSPVLANGLHVEMEEPADHEPGLVVAESASDPVSLSHLKVTGAWKGIGIFGEGELSLADSQVTTPPSSSAAAIEYISASAPRGLVVQRSTLQASPTLAPTAVEIYEGSATFDSSAIFGGKRGIEDYVSASAPTYQATLTVSASTIDAGAPGVLGDAPDTYSIFGDAEKGPGNSVSIKVQGSILLEPQLTKQASGDQVSSTCAYSAVPSQVQGAGPEAASIACADGSNGNTPSTPSALFAGIPAAFEPVSNYQLAPGSPAIDAVPQSALALPFGITRSSTDLAGAPRVVDGKRDCKPVQDMGALELQTQTVPCISSLRLQPRSFVPAKRGASLVRRGHGAKLSWQDSEAATVTFTVLRPVAGRLKGHTCVRLSRTNSRRRHCQAYAVVGSFKHRDRAGTNSAVFTGRVGHALRAGRYELQALARNSRGHGIAVLAPFTVR